ncbi:MAG TPA: archaetidylinositol phosphate synthase [Candidatus Acidoferrum sp.]|nr:archaetidylinositol phosphate synthase [Candidatus Acidoferrum sp.]
MLTKLKQKIQQMLTAEATAAHRLGLTPNWISLIGAIFALFAALSYLEWQDGWFYLPLAIIMILLSGFCDALDGIVARLFQQTTAFGGFLDSLLDRYADAAIYIAMIISGLCWPLWGLLALVGSLLVSYSRARAEAVGVKMESVGIAERAERMIILVVATLIASTRYWPPSTVINYAMILLAVLSNFTVMQRGLYAYGKLKKKVAS